MNVFEAMSLFNEWTLIKDRAMSKDEVVSLVTHLTTTGLASISGVSAVANGADVTTIATAVGTLAGIAYKVYLSRKLLNTTPPKK